MFAMKNETCDRNGKYIGWMTERGEAKAISSNYRN